MAEKVMVTTEKLKEKQEEWLLNFEQIRGGFREIEELLNSLEQIFMGKPVEIIREKAVRRQEEGMAVLTGLKIHLEKMEKIAVIYDQVERSNINVISDN